MENNLFTILDTHISDELVSEGLAREFISKIQQMRKSSGFEVLDNITFTLKAMLIYLKLWKNIKITLWKKL